MPLNISTDEAIHEHFVEYGYDSFAVLDKGDMLGTLSLKEITDIPPKRCIDITVSEVFVCYDKRCAISKKEEAIKVLEKYNKQGKERLSVLKKWEVNRLDNVYGHCEICADERGNEEVSRFALKTRKTDIRKISPRYKHVSWEETDYFSMFVSCKIS
ncbi:MAG: hypothetical protein AB1552_13745 [Nitrospirota bacterium]